MKKLMAMLLALVMVLILAACGGSSAPAATQAPAAEEGKAFNIYAWNEEFKGFFEKYYTVPEGITVNWIINPSDGGVYQAKLDSWDKFNAVAADAKAKGYYMTSSESETFRVFSDNGTSALVDDPGKLALNDSIKACCICSSFWRFCQS